MIRAISLDFWGTIAVFNPDYTKALVGYIADTFEISEDDAMEAYKSVKWASDKAAEQYGESILPLEAIRRVIARECGEAPHPTLISAEASFRDIYPIEFLDTIERLVRENPPFLHRDFPEVIDGLQRKGYRVGVSSNTNFISGHVLQDVFKLPWDFAVYSGELGAAKPSSQFFLAVLSQARKVADIYGPSEILHVGDNKICDGDGAHAVGFTTKVIADPDETIALLREYL